MSQIFIKRLTDLLDECKTREAMQLFQREDREIIEDSLGDIVPAVVSYLTNSVLQYKKTVYDCCLSILMCIAENYKPKEAILEFLQCLRCAKDDINFCAILDVVCCCMLKMQNKSNFIDWCINAIKTYISKLPLLDEDDDPEAISNRIIQVYKGIIAFLAPLVREARNLKSEEKKGFLLRDSLLSFLISLCGEPFCYLNKYVTEKTEYKKLTDDIVTLALDLTRDILYFLDIVSKRQRNIISNKFIAHDIYNKHSMFFECNNIIPDIAYANFYFYIITNEKYWKHVPQVYNSYYIFETCAYFFKILLSKEYLVSNGLIFMENVMKCIPLRSVDSKVLELDIYTELFQPIINVMIYSGSDKQRKKAIHIFEAYIELFNMEAKYTVILYLYEITEHSGLLSFITGMFKFSIIQCLDSTPRNPQFLGKNMELLLKKICSLPHGSSSDVVEISDEIITALNLLRFLFIRDKKNETGIWNMKDTLKNDYLDPLREGIDLCKAHWRVKMEDLEQQKKDLAKERDYGEAMKAHMEVTLTVGGEQLPIMSISDKISFCHQAINGLDVMESILIRVNECIDTNEISLG